MPKIPKNSIKSINITKKVPLVEKSGEKWLQMDKTCDILSVSKHKEGYRSMFTGMSYHQLDDKGRLRLPAKFRTELGKAFVLMKGINDSIAIYPQKTFEAMCEEYMQYDQTDIEVQSAITEIISWSHEVEEDAQGRFVIPLQHREFASIGKNVVLKGSINRIEIWSDQSHEQRTSNRPTNDLMQVINKAKNKVAQNG